MNCWKGICKYKTDNGNLCLLDKDKGLPVKPCDMEHEPQHTDKCRHFDALTCRKHCYAYLWCQETQKGKGIMKFYATSRLGLLYTDDYTEEEISRELHVKHIKDNLKNEFPEVLARGLCVRIYDENDKLVRDMFLYA